MRQNGRALALAKHTHCPNVQQRPVKSLACAHLPVGMVRLHCLSEGAAAHQCLQQSQDGRMQFHLDCTTGAAIAGEAIDEDTSKWVDMRCM